MINNFTNNDFVLEFERICGNSWPNTSSDFSRMSKGDLLTVYDKNGRKYTLRVLDNGKQKEEIGGSISESREV